MYMLIGINLMDSALLHFRGTVEINQFEYALCQGSGYFAVMFTKFDILREK